MWGGRESKGVGAGGIFNQTASSKMKTSLFFISVNVVCTSNPRANCDPAVNCSIYVQ